MTGWVKLTQEQQTAGNMLSRVISALGHNLQGAFRFDATLPVPTSVSTLTVDMDEARAEILLDQRYVQRLSTSYHQLANDHEIPEPLQALVFEVGATPILEQLEQILGMSLKVHSYAARGPEDLNGFMGFVGEGGPIEGISFHIKMIQGRPKPGLSLSQPPEGWTRTFPVNLSRMVMTASDLQTLSPMDILLPGIERTEEQALKCRLVITGYLSISGYLNGTVFTAEDILKGNVMSDVDAETTEAVEAEAQDAETAAEQDIPAATMIGEDTMATLPVELDFDLGRLELSYAEVAAMTAGQSFDLGNKADEAVTIRVNGRTVGSGALVEIDGRIGVRINKLIKTGAGNA